MDFFIAVFGCWQLPQMHWLLGAMKACVQCLPTDGRVCNIDKTKRLLVPIIGEQMSMASFETALAVLLSESESLFTPSNEAEYINVRVCIDNVRVLFLIGFLYDYRIRACVLTPTSPIHKAFRTRPPDRGRLCRMFEQDFGGLANGFLEDVRLIRQHEDEDAFIRVVTCADDLLKFVDKWYLKSEKPMV
jgi:hypothetical protein